MTEKLELANDSNPSLDNSMSLTGEDVASIGGDKDLFINRDEKKERNFDDFLYKYV